MHGPIWLKTLKYEVIYTHRNINSQYQIQLTFWNQNFHVWTLRRTRKPFSGGKIHLDDKNYALETNLCNVANTVVYKFVTAGSCGKFANDRNL